MQFKTYFSKLVAACLVLTLAGCTTSDTLMKQSLNKGTSNNEASALKLTQFLASSSDPECPQLQKLTASSSVDVDKLLRQCQALSKYVNDYKQMHLRCWALRGLSYYQEIPEITLDVIAWRLLDPRANQLEKSWAAFAMGHFQRKESIPYFLQALNNHPNDELAYYILESLARQVGLFTNEQELSIQLLSALNTYLSQTTQTPPAIYSLLQEYVSTLTTLVLTMEDVLQKHPAGKRHEADYQELYTGIYNLFHAMEVKKEQLLNNFAANEASLQKAFDVAYKGLDTRYQPAFLLYAWYAGELSTNPELATLASGKLQAWLTTSDRELRTLVVWALLRMELYNSPTRTALLKHLSETETDSHILNMLANYRYFQDEPDVIQQLRGLEINQ